MHPQNWVTRSAAPYILVKKLIGWINTAKPANSVGRILCHPAYCANFFMPRSLSMLLWLETSAYSVIGYSVIMSDRLQCRHKTPEYDQ